MAGNSNSGRLPAYEEFNKSHVINKLWEKVRIKVDKGEELSEYEEKLVLSLLPKTIKTDIGLDANIAMTVNIDNDIAETYGINPKPESNS